MIKKLIITAGLAAFAMVSASSISSAGPGPGQPGPNGSGVTIKKPIKLDTKSTTITRDLGVGDRVERLRARK